MKIITPLIFALLMTACSQSPTVPKCGDVSTVDLVKKITDQEMTKQLGPDAARMFSYDVNAIRTTRTDETTGFHDCAAELQVFGNEQPQSFQITYKVEITDDGEQIYVSVFGL